MLCFVCPSSQDLLVGPDSWSVSELVHVIAIMAHYHSLAGFCLGCGVNPEIDTPMGHAHSPSSSSPSSCGEDVPLLMNTLNMNPALGIGRRTPSDSESETLSPAAAHSPTALDGSPTNRTTKSRVEHFIQSELLSLLLSEGCNTCPSFSFVFRSTYSLCFGL